MFRTQPHFKSRDKFGHAEDFDSDPDPCAWAIHSKMTVEVPYHRFFCYDPDMGR